MLGNISTLEVTCERQQLDSTIFIKVLSPVNSCFSIGVLWGCALCASWRLDLHKRVKTTGTVAVATPWAACNNQSAFIYSAVLRDAFICMAAGQLKTAMAPYTNLAPPHSTVRQYNLLLFSTQHPWYLDIAQYFAIPIIFKFPARYARSNLRLSLPPYWIWK